MSTIEPNIGPEITISIVDKTDLEEFLSVEAAAFGGASSTNRLLKACPSSIVYAVKDYRGIMGGMVVFMTSYSPLTWNILSLFVLPPYRGRGIATSLLERFLRDQPTGDVNLLAETDKIGIYKRCGFKIKSYGMELERSA